MKYLFTLFYFVGYATISYPSENKFVNQTEQTGAIIHLDETNTKFDYNQKLI